MIEESNLKSNFIGRDGFRWWIGQIPPMESMSEQFEGGGWGNRFKVRILGYHTLDENELPNEDLPWAIVMLGSTDGTGSANFSKSTKIRPGDVVFGFFIDGDNAQNPVIMGLLGNTDQYAKGNYKTPFSPFTGYTTNIPKADKEVSTANEANEAKGNSQQGPVQLPVEKAKQVGRAAAGGEAIGQKATFANTCENTTISNIETALENLIKFLQERQGKISEFQEKIDETADVIKSSMNWLVGEIIKAINVFLVGDPDDATKPGIIPTALNALYTTVYTATLPAAGPAAAHIAGSEAIAAFVLPITVLEKALICVTNLLLEGLITLIKELLLSMVDNIENFVTCVVDQFVGSLLTSVVDRIAGGLSDALGALSGLLGGVIDIASIAQDAISLFNSLGNLLDCNQVNTKCDGSKEWIIGVGAKDAIDINQSFDSIFGFVNDTSALINDGINAGRGIVDSATGAFDSIDEGIRGTVDIFNSSAIAQGDFVGGVKRCLPVYPTSCGSAQIKIFGGGGTGGSAVPIFGPTVARALNDTSIGQNVNKTAGIIGATLKNAGSGYRFPPFVEITDECGIGYGARGRATINSKGEIDSIYIVSSGEGYPTDNQESVGVTDVTIVATGIGYDKNDTATDNFGNEYSLIIDNGRIISATPINITEVSDLVTIKVNSETGLGAVLKPILGTLSSQGLEADGTQKGFIKSIDCID